ncbi:MAG: hypothetical protein IJM26_07560 [Lachnospiraceae bacterium]|nr:hypothetical protein [Lachnospiraceae bacterium]
MKKKAVALLTLAAVLCLSILPLAGCGKSEGAAPGGETTRKESGENETKKDSAEAETKKDSAESETKQYAWDKNGDMKMHWETGDDYTQYIKLAEEACPLGTVDDTPFVSMKAIFPSWSGWPTHQFSDTEVTPWHFEADADLGETAKENGEYLTVWGSLSYPGDPKVQATSTVEDNLSYFLVGDRTKDAKEGTLVTTGLRTKEINGLTVKYVRMQFEYDYTVSPDQTVTLCVQRTNAIVPVEAPDGSVVYLDVMIDEYRTDSTVLSDDSIIDLIFENMTISK